MKYLNDTILANSAWRVFTQDDLSLLLCATKSYYEPASKLCENVNWSTSPWDGTNDLGFSLKPCGGYVDNNSFYKLNGVLLLLNKQSTTKYMATRRDESKEDFTKISISSFSGKWFIPIRLCRNLK